MLNKAQLIGFTGADSEIRTTPKGKKYAVLRIATSRYSKKEGERQDFTTWHQVEIWSPGTVKWLESRVLAKGTKVYVEGEIRHEQYTDDKGQKHYFAKIVVADALARQDAARTNRQPQAVVAGWPSPARSGRAFPVHSRPKGRHGAARCAAPCGGPNAPP